MSCFIVERSHVRFIVDVAIACGAPWHDGSPQALGAMLWAENVKSFNYRYEGRHQEDIGDTRYGSHESDPQAVKASSAGQMLLSLHCFEYQACEHPGWRTSNAFAFCRVLERKLMEGYPDAKLVPGYEGGIWGAPEPSEVTP